MAQKKRSRNFSVTEQNLLIELLEPYQNIVNDKRTSCAIVRKKIDTWRKIADEFSSHGHGYRTAEELKTLWKRLKIEVKKKLAENKREVRRTGGGTLSVAPISPRTKRIAGLIVADELTPPLTAEFDSDALAMACANVGIAVEERSFVGENDEADTTIPHDLNFEQQLQPSPNQSAIQPLLLNDHLQNADGVNPVIQHRKGMSAFHSKLLDFAEIEHRQKMKNLKLKEELLTRKLESMKK